MSSLSFDEAFVAETERFIEIIQQADADAPVPSCPEWTAADLAWHLAEVQHFWANMITGRPAAAPENYDRPERPATFSDIMAMLQQSYATLRDGLASAADSEAAWSWHEPNQTVGFTRRRQVHEALIHRVDAELAAGVSSAVDPQVAADGVLEVFELYYGGALPDWVAGPVPGPVGRVELTDTGHSWLVRVDSWSGTSPTSGTDYVDEPVLALLDDAASAPTFEVAASAAAMDLWLWNRGPAEPITMTGDVPRFERLVAVPLD